MGLLGSSFFEFWEGDSLCCGPSSDSGGVPFAGLIVYMVHVGYMFVIPLSFLYMFEF